MDAPNRLRSDKTSPKRDITALQGLVMIARGNTLGITSPTVSLP